MVRVRPVVPDDYEAVTVLCRRHGLPARSREGWDHLWSGNPALAGRDRSWVRGWVLEHGNEVVGYIGNVPLHYAFQGRTLLAAALTSSVVDRAWRRLEDPRYPRAILKLLEPFYHQPGVDFMMSSTASRSQERNHAMFGARRVPSPGYDVSLFWTTDPGRFARSVVALQHLPAGPLLAPVLAGALHLEHAAGSAIGRLRSTGFAPRRTRYRLRRREGFDRAFDDFWERLRRAYSHRLLRVRDARTLNWHFAGPLAEKRVRILCACRDEDPDAMVGYAILLRADVAEVELTRMSLVDLQVLPGHEDVLRDLVEAAIQVCRAEQVAVLEAVGFNGEKRAKLARGAHRRKLPSWRFYYRVPDDALGRTLHRREVWDPSGLDGDTTL